MTGAERQLAFEIAPRPAFGSDDFLVSPSNEGAFAYLERWPEWPDPLTLLVGPEGVGKSHMATIWARRAGAAPVTPLDLRAGRAPQGPTLIDDADAFSDEVSLFHAINLATERGAGLLLTARTVPEAWPVRLPDLLSRLRRATRINIDPPDDDLLRAVLVKHFVDRQLLIDTSVVEFVARRIDRSLGAARAVVRRLDIEALASGRRISRGLAAEVLHTDWQNDDERVA